MRIFIDVYSNIGPLFFHPFLFPLAAAVVLNPLFLIVHDDFTSNEVKRVIFTLRGDRQSPVSVVSCTSFFVMQREDDVR